MKKMASEAQYLRQKRYRQNHAEQLDAYHKQWLEEHRDHWNAYMREYRRKRERQALGWYGYGSDDNAQK
jgi:hypothetical protein